MSKTFCLPSHVSFSRAWCFLLAFGVAAGAGAAVINVPGDFANLQTAINQSSTGDVIEIDSGTYNGTFLISGQNANKTLTLRAAPGANPVLSGSSSVPVLRYLKVSPNSASVVFQGLTFANGVSTTNGIGGGVTVTRGNATFIDCVFENNAANAANTGGGALFLFDQSVVHVFGSRFENNTTPNAGAGIRQGNGTSLYVHDSELINNRTSVAGHTPGSAGGAIHMTNAELRISNTRFVGNRAGCVGGAVFALGTPWVDPVTVPTGTAWVVNSTFIDNGAEIFPGRSCGFTPVGGGIHSENQVEVFVINSRFEDNFATSGGAITQYRSKMTVEQSVFRRNFATGASSSQGFAGAISANSNDVVDDTTAPGGTTDRPSTSTIIRDSIFEGRPSGSGVLGGCIFTEGDVNRTYGRFGVPIQGTAATNRAELTIERTVFHGCVVTENDPLGAAGKGGAITASHTALTLDDVLIASSEAPNGGGCLWTLLDTAATITDTTFAYCSGEFGGAINASGSDLNITGSQFFGNETSLQGAAIWTAESVEAGFPNLDARGLVQQSVFSDNGDGNLKTDIFDRDKNTAGQPINRMRYVDNEFADAGNDFVYDSDLTAQLTAAQINTAQVMHPQNGVTIDKGSGNVDVGAAPNLGAILAKPDAILPVTAAGDSEATAPSYLGFALSGSSPTLDGGSLGATVTGLQTDGAGVHTLAVGGEMFTATITNGPAPRATFQAVPFFTETPSPANLEWSTVAGTFVDMAIDRGVTTASTAAGSVGISPPNTTEYQLYLLTREGGTRETTSRFIGELPGLIFTDGFESGNTTRWSP